MKIADVVSLQMAQYVYLSAVIVSAMLALARRKKREKHTTYSQSSFADLFSNPPLSAVMAFVSMGIVLIFCYIGFRVPIDIQLYYKTNNFQWDLYPLPQIKTSVFIRTSQVVSAACWMIITIKAIRALFGLTIFIIIAAISAISIRYIFQIQI